MTNEERMNLIIAEYLVRLHPYDPYFGFFTLLKELEVELQEEGYTRDEILNIGYPLVKVQLLDTVDNTVQRMMMDKPDFESC